MMRKFFTNLLMAVIFLLVGCGPDKEKVELVRHAVHQAEETIATIRKDGLRCNEKIKDLVYSAEKLKRDKCREVLIENSSSSIESVQSVLLDDLADIDEFSEKCSAFDALFKESLRTIDENLKVVQTGKGEIKDGPGSFSDPKKLIDAQEKIARRRLLRWKQINF